METHRKHKTIKRDDRLRIDALYRMKIPVKEIAKQIGCCRATIYNELKRCTYIHTNSDLTEEVRYNPYGAQQIAEWKQTAKGPKLKIDKDHRLAKFIEEKICDEKYSPGAIIKYIRNHPEECNFAVDILSPNTIYSYIDKGIFLRAERKFLPHGHKFKKKKQKEIVRHRKSSRDRIDKRPSEADNREVFGHWEMDTVKSGKNDPTAELVLTERKTRFEIVEPLRRDTEDEVRKALNRIEKDMGSKIFRLFKTVTCDNGSEFMDPDSMEQALYRTGKRFTIYYCHPYSSWQRGTNENNNRLIRRFVPKGRSFGELTRKEIKEIQRWVNNYPRKIFDGRTSKDMFLEEINSLGIELPKIVGG